MSSGNSSIFLGSLYVALVVAVAVAVSSFLLETSILTIVARTSLAFVTFAFLGWAAERILGWSEPNNATEGDGDPRGALVDVVLPSTEQEQGGEGQLTE